MSKTEQFMGLALDDAALHTPEGDFALEDITRAEFVRETEVGDRDPSTEETSMPAVAGGAAAGGVLLGGAGAVVGGVLGSTQQEEVPGRRHVTTLSATLVVETATDSYSLAVPREQEVAAISFAHKVDKAAKKHRR
jgi:hypothetical protein